MIISDQPYKQGLVILPRILNWIEIKSGIYKGKFATNEVNLKFFSKEFKNIDYEIALLDESAFEYDFKDISDIKIKIEYTEKNEVKTIVTDKQNLSDEEIKKLISEQP